MTEIVSAAQADRYSYYRHTLPIRIMHWINVICLTILLMSGLNIFNAHPALYWGKSSYTGAPALLQLTAREDDEGELVGITQVGRYEFDTTGLLGASTGPDGALTARGFPSWLTIPDGQWLAMARRWHLFFAWMLVINGIAYVLYSLATRHLRRDLTPTATDWRGIGRSIKDHILFRHPAGEESKRYNVLQKLAYLTVIFVLLPLIIIMGWGMSPWLNSIVPGWVDIVGGRQSARTLHFILAWMLVAFVLIHVFEVIVTGVWNNVRSMITGKYTVKPETRHDK